MTGFLTTHVLDTTHGCPADTVQIELWRLDILNAGRILLKTVHTNAEGRTDEPLLQRGDMLVGVYELIFAVGVYFSQRAVTTSVPPFLDIVPIRFGIADPAAHYHIPLLVSPWAYSTYRGS